MTTLAELIAAGRFDLYYAVQRYGVYEAAERMGWETTTGRRRARAEEAGDGGDLPI